MEGHQKKIETQLLIIGGGATGAGIFRDAAKRGISTVLVEKKDFATGTSGRNHGLLHSGARYAVKDPVSAKECITENTILKKIASSVVEDTGGFFIALDDSDLGYSELLIPALGKSGIAHEEVTLESARRDEPHLHSGVKRIIRVPDGSVDPFRLAIMNIKDGEAHGQTAMNYTEVVDSRIHEGAIEWVKVINHFNNEEILIYPEFVVNASGPWADVTAGRLYATMKMKPSMGVMVILDHRVVNHVINRMRMPADGDIIVPGDTVSIIGTTSRPVEYHELDQLKATPEEIYRMIQDAEKLVPRFATSRMLRHYSGARPLPDVGKSGREVSRNFLIKDHGQENEPRNLFSITGGKLMTYRQMAEKMTDIIATRLGNQNNCRTATDELPPIKKSKIKIPDILKNNYGIQQGYQRQGDSFLEKIHGKKDTFLVCECEMITNAEIEYVLETNNIKKLTDIRRRTRLGMGPCQGTLCSVRTMEISGIKERPFGEKETMLRDFTQERWRGVRHVLWGDTLRNEEFALWLYSGIFGWKAEK